MPRSFGAVRPVVQVRKTASGYVVPVVVTPGSGGDALRGEHDGRLKVSVSAPPEKGRANRALCRFLARKLGIRHSQVSIVSGYTSRRKEVLVERVPPGALDGIIA